MLDKTDFAKLKNHQEVLAGHKANLLFSDFKNRKIVFLGDKRMLVNFRLRKMKAEFLNMPELAQCCSLADIVPPFQV